MNVSDGVGEGVGWRFGRREVGESFEEKSLEERDPRATGAALRDGPARHRRAPGDFRFPRYAFPHHFDFFAVNVFAFCS